MLDVINFLESYILRVKNEYHLFRIAPHVHLHRHLFLRLGKDTYPTLPDDTSTKLQLGIYDLDVCLLICFFPGRRFFFTYAPGGVVKSKQTLRIRPATYPVIRNMVDDVLQKNSGKLCASLVPKEQITKSGLSCAIASHTFWSDIRRTGCPVYPI